MRIGARLYDAFNEILKKVGKLEQGFKEQLRKKVS